MVFIHHFNFEDMDNEELHDLLDETDEPEFRQKIKDEIAKRAQDKADNPPRYLLTAGIIAGLFGLVGLLVFLSVR